MSTNTYPTADEAFDFATLKKFCEMHETDFATALDMETVISPHHVEPENFYLFKDNGSNILAVAHLDTCVAHEDRTTVLHEDEETGLMVRSGALDDRLGAYVIADTLPKMGMTFDLLYTVGEESGMSTAEAFDPSHHHDRQYDWIIEFDRGGTDVVLYQYEDDDLIDRVEATGVPVSPGMFSDIAFMEHLGIKGINWGVGYRDYHSVNGHVYLDDLFDMVNAFAEFYDNNKNTHLPHTDTGQGMSGHAYSVELDYDEYWGDLAPVVTENGGWVRSSRLCEAADWEVGVCDGPLVEDPALGTLCEKHEVWANSPI